MKINFLSENVFMHAINLINKIAYCTSVLAEKWDFALLSFVMRKMGHSKCHFSKNIGTIHVKLVDLLPSPNIMQYKHQIITCTHFIF